MKKTICLFVLITFFTTCNNVSDKKFKINCEFISQNKTNIDLSNLNKACDFADLISSIINRLMIMDKGKTLSNPFRDDELNWSPDQTEEEKNSIKEEWECLKIMLNEVGYNALNRDIRLLEISKCIDDLSDLERRLEDHDIYFFASWRTRERESLR